MRKTLFFILMAFCITQATAQSKLGLKFSPTMASNRISLVDSLYDVEPDGSRFKFSIGLIYDHEITETYFLSTGLILVPKTVALMGSEEVDQQANADYTGEPLEEYRLNYLQVPVSLKLFTNEIQPDLRIYFQVGMAADFKVFNEPLEEDYQLIQEFKGFDATVIFGGGLEYRAGINTTLFGGITYQRGLGNVVKTESQGFQNELFIRTSLISLDLGIKF